MERFCDDLRRERELHGVSLDTISEVTRISSRHLRALEAGDIGQLPGGVFRHGILRNYLSVLGLDPTPWIDRFDTEQRLTAPPADVDQPEDPSAELAQFAENVHRSRPTAAAQRDLRWFGVLVMLFLLAALGWSVWRYVLHGHVTLSTAAAAGATSSSR